MEFNQLRMQSRAYESIFQIENLLRAAMHSRMVETHGLGYFNEAVFPEYQHRDSGKTINVVQAAKTRKGLEKTSGISLRYDFHMIWYLDYADLILMLDAFWDKYFGLIFKPNTDKTILISRLISLRGIRNAIAHNRYLSRVNRALIEAHPDELKICLKDTYLSNYDVLALNSMEKQCSTALTGLRTIHELITSYRVIKSEHLHKTSDLISILISRTDNQDIAQLYDSIFKLIPAYNRLPRKPATSHIIIHFLDENKMIEKVLQLMSAIGDIS